MKKIISSIKKVLNKFAKWLYSKTSDGTELLPKHVYGDANGDGMVDVSDINTVMGVMTGQIKEN